MRFFYVELPDGESRQKFETGELPANSTVFKRGEIGRALRALKAFDPAIVVTAAHYPRLLAVAAIWGRITGRKVCYLSDTNYFDIQKRPFWWRIAKRAVFRLYLGQMWGFLPMGSANEAFYDWCCGPGWRRKFRARVPYPHDPELFQAACGNGNPRRLDKRVTCLYLGRLVPEKGVENLLEALALLSSALLPELRVVIGGDGPCKSSLMEYVHTRGLGDTVEFLGPIPSDMAVELFHKCDILVLTSYSEPWGLVVNEALSSCRPVLAPAGVGAVIDLVRDGINGFVLNDNDPLTIASGLGRVLEYRGRLREMGKRGRESVSSGAWSLQGALEGWAKLAGQA
ncbi:MAG TPA: glycosyltransferase family 4 protein [Candidatus Angelobacter sp.]|nr:glycosyltransferase family 4 protein [Candidatus Angelobacter sp.]